MNITELVKQFIDLPDVDLVWAVWHRQLREVHKKGAYFEIRHIEKYTDKLANPGTILRIKRKLNHEKQH